MKYQKDIKTPLGFMTITSENESLIGLDFKNKTADFLQNKQNLKTQNFNLNFFMKVEKWLKLYFSGGNPKINFDLKANGTKFQETIWRFLREIPYGQTITYGDLAKKYANLNNLKKMSAQAVGGAVGKNPIAIIIPCHRVLGVNKKLTGYAGGLDRKEKLLEVEEIIFKK
jgi:methylated-DNA-[protein]-cysteine S-methyltransferase